MAIKKKKRWIDRRCCDWDTFLNSFTKAAEIKRFPLLMVDRMQARSDWRRYGMTGHEALIMQYNRALEELYDFGSEPPKGRRDDDRGPDSDPPMPKPKQPLRQI